MSWDCPWSKRGRNALDVSQQTQSIQFSKSTATEKNEFYFNDVFLWITLLERVDLTQTAEVFILIPVDLYLRNWLCLKNKFLNDP